MKYLTRYITACQLNMDRKPKVMQVLNVSHFCEDHEYGDGADKIIVIIMDHTNLGFEPT